MDTEDRRDNATPQQPYDDGLRTMLMWTGIALVVSIVMAMIGVELVMRLFGPG